MDAPVLSDPRDVTRSIRRKAPFILLLMAYPIIVSVYFASMAVFLPMIMLSLMVGAFVNAITNVVDSSQYGALNVAAYAVGIGAIVVATIRFARRPYENEEVDGAAADAIRDRVNVLLVALGSRDMRVIVHENAQANVGVNATSRHDEIHVTTGVLELARPEGDAMLAQAIATANLVQSTTWIFGIARFPSLVVRWSFRFMDTLIERSHVGSQTVRKILGGIVAIVLFLFIIEQLFFELFLIGVLSRSISTYFDNRFRELADAEACLITRNPRALTDALNFQSEMVAVPTFDDPRIIEVYPPASPEATYAPATFIGTFLRNRRWSWYGRRLEGLAALGG